MLGHAVDRIVHSDHSYDSQHRSENNCHNPSPSQSPSPKSIDPTSYMEDSVILDKAPDVELSSNSYSRL